MARRQFVLSGILLVIFCCPFLQVIAAGASLPSEEVVVNSIGMKLRLISPGEFIMGSNSGLERERPPHKVKISKPFFIGVFEVTQGEYLKVMKGSVFRWIGENYPAYRVNYPEAKLFCKKLSALEGTEYRLPTEAEWEYACRARSQTDYFWGDRFDDRYCWYYGNSSGTIHPVGLKKPNNWGLFDMVGNADELCEDYLQNYSGDEVTDPVGVVNRSECSVRGGTYACRPPDCRSAYREFGEFLVRFHGFRVVRVIPSSKKP